MTTTTVLAAIGSAVVIVHAVARLPQAITELARACIPAVTALRELRTAITGRGVHGARHDALGTDRTASASQAPADHRFGDEGRRGDGAGWSGGATARVSRSP